MWTAWTAVAALGFHLVTPLQPSEATLMSLEPRCRSEADATADLYASGALLPVDAIDPSTLVDTFTMMRTSKRLHQALDILAPQGRAVRAVDDGVIRIATNPMGGNTVLQVDSSGCVGFYYAHIDDWAPGLKTGQHVKKGDLLGFVGETGNAQGTQPHLHLGTYHLPRRGKFEFKNPMNPYHFFVAPEQS